MGEKAKNRKKKKKRVFSRKEYFLLRNDSVLTPDPVKYYRMQYKWMSGFRMGPQSPGLISQNVLIPRGSPLTALEAKCSRSTLTSFTPLSTPAASPFSPAIPGCSLQSPL